MSGTVDLKSLARRVLQRDTAWDSERDRVSQQGGTVSETSRQYQRLNRVDVPPVPDVPGVPADSAVCAVCNAAGDLWHYCKVLVHRECVRFLPKPEAAEPTAAHQGVTAEPDGIGCRVEIVELPQAQRYRKAFALLQLKPPALVPVLRWRRCVKDGSRFLAKWGEQAEALGWSSADLFRLHIPPEQPHHSYSRLSRYDAMGLIWLLRGRPVVALTEATAAIESPTGNITMYRRFNKPALGPLGDSLDDLR